MYIFDKMILSEANYKPEPEYLKKQKQLNPKMRLILLDWMMEVCEEFMLKRETFYTAVNYVDRYLEILQCPLPKNELQLLGVSSMFLATKVEEVYVPRVSDFALSTDGGYNE